MAAKKRKSVSVEPTAKRQKLVANKKSSATAEKKTVSTDETISYKSKQNKCVEKRNKVSKASLQRLTKKTPRNDAEQPKPIAPKFKRKSVKSNPVEKVQLKKTVLKSTELLSLKTVGQVSLRCQNIVVKSSRNSFAKVSESSSKAVSKKTTNFKSNTPPRLQSVGNGIKVPPDTSRVKSARTSVLKSIKPFKKAPLRIIHLQNTTVTSISRQNVTLPAPENVKGSTPAASKNIYEMNSRKQELEGNATSLLLDRNATHSETKLHSDENSIQSRTATRKNVRPINVTNRITTHRNIKIHSKAKTLNKPVQEKKAARAVPESKEMSVGIEHQGRKSQRLQPISKVLVKSSQKRGTKERKVSKSRQNSAATKGQPCKIQTNKPCAMKKKSEQKGKTKATRLQTKVEVKGSKEKSKTAQSQKEINHKVNVSKVEHKLADSNSHSKGFPKCELSQEQILHPEAEKTIQQPAALAPCRKSKKEKGSTLKTQKEKPKQKRVKKDKEPSKKLVTPKVKHKLKNSKASKQQQTVPESATQPETDPKSKRVSILELCGEIADEIESDTVEVRKEFPGVICEVEAAKSPDELPPQVEAENQNLAGEEVKQITPTKCFFPSKKSPSIKNRLNGNISPIMKNSKRNELKPLRINHVIRKNVLNQAALPTLEILRRSVSAPSKEIQARTTDMRPLFAGTSSPGRLPVMQHNKGKPIENSVSLGVVWLERDTSKEVLHTSCYLPVTQLDHNLITEKVICLDAFGPNETPLERVLPSKRAAENGMLEMALDESFSLRLDSSPESSPKKVLAAPRPPKQTKLDIGDWELEDSMPIELVPVRKLLTDQALENNEKRDASINPCTATNTSTSVSTSETNLQREVKKLKEAVKDGDNQPVIDAGQKRFGAISCNVCGMLYTASNPEDETQHSLFHTRFVSAVKFVGWKKERIVAEFPDGKIIMVFPDDPKYARKKVEEIREMVDNDLGFQQAPLRIHARTKTLLFISNDKKVVGCLIAEHIQWGYRVLNEKMTSSNSERETAIYESQKAWCCSTVPEPALCGISRIWVFRMMRRQKIATRMIECLRGNFIYGWYLGKEEIAFSDPTPDGKLFATRYCGTGQFLVYNFISGQSKST